MDSIMTLVLLALGMWIGMVMSGLIPIIIPKSPKVLMGLNLFGAGMLFGVAIGVMLSESIILVYDYALSHDGDHDHLRREIKDFSDLDTKGTAVAYHTVIAICIVSGFVAMMLVSEILKAFTQKAIHRGEETKQHSFDISGENLPQSLKVTLQNPAEDEDKATSVIRKSEKAKGVLTTIIIGMIFDCVADGATIGASAFMGQSSMLIFVAIVLHHFPMYFEFSVYLFYLNFPKMRVFKYVMLLSIISPIIAGITFSVLAFSDHAKSTQFVVAIILLISTGIFLYISTVEIFPEFIGSGHTQVEITENKEEQQEPLFPNWIKVPLVLIGIAIPLSLTAVFPHKH